MNDPESVELTTRMSGLARSGEIKPPAAYIDAGAGHEANVTWFGR